jgi:hypothetical protein
MIRGFCLTATALVLFAAPAFAQDMCGPSPTAPVVPDGKKATGPELVQAKKDIDAFIKASDDWQLCLVTYRDQQVAAAKDTKTAFDVRPINTKIDGNQKSKEKVGGDYNKQVVVWRQAHPK